MQDKSDMLPQSTQQDIDVLAHSDASEHQSQWVIYKTLPKSQKWPYFYHHFFWPIIVSVVAAVAVIAFVINMIVTPKGQGLTVAFIDIKESSQQIDELQKGFLNYRAVNKDLVNFHNEFSLGNSSDTSTENSQETFNVELSGGSLNTLISTKAGLESSDVRDYVEPLNDVLTQHQLNELSERGAIVELPIGDHGTAEQVALDLSMSQVWEDHSDSNTDALLGFINVQNKQYVRLFVDYMFGM